MAGWIVLLLSCSSTADPSDSVFGTLFPTAAERASCGVYNLLGTGGGPFLTRIVLAVAYGLFCLFG